VSHGWNWIGVRNQLYPTLELESVEKQVAFLQAGFLKSAVLFLPFKLNHMNKKSLKAGFKFPLNQRASQCCRNINFQRIRLIIKN